MADSPLRTLSCPACPTGTALVSVDRSGIQVDACPSCRGVWLDRGELDKLIALEASQNDDFLAEIQGASRQETPSSGHHGGDEHGSDRGQSGQHGSSGKRRKRGGILGDLFDIS